jgi:hypothetical protein
MFQIYEILERIYALRALEKTRQSKMIFREREREGAREREREKGKHGQMPVWVEKFPNNDQRYVVSLRALC